MRYGDVREWSQRHSSDPAIGLRRSDYLGLLQAAYESEIRESIHIFQRCGFILTAIVLLGTIAAALANGQWIKDFLPRVDVVLYLASIILVFGALATAIVMLTIALCPRSWTFAPPSMRELADAVGVREQAGKWVLSDGHDKLLNAEGYAQCVGDFVAAIDSNRARNKSRYTWLYNAFVVLIVAVFLVFIEVIMHAIVYLSNP